MDKSWQIANGARNETSWTQATAGGDHICIPAKVGRRTDIVLGLRDEVSSQAH